MHVVMVSSEVAPFSKSGGMGDVVAALATSLTSAGHGVTTVSPRYASVDPTDLVDTQVLVRAHLGTSTQVARILRRPSAPGTPVHLFVEHGVFSERNGLYGDVHGSFGDNHIRFTLLQRAACEAARCCVNDEAPVFHVHDWQTAALPVWLEQLYRPLGLFVNSPTVLTLHNPKHQGRLPAALFQDLDLPRRWFTAKGLEWYGDLGLLKAGILLADQLTTVSPTFAWDITQADGGFGLDALFRARFEELRGILNGIDTTVWDPSSDPHLKVPYSAQNLSGKTQAKADLQEAFGLTVDPARPLLGFVGRLDPQKGVEMLLESLPWILEQQAQVVVLGSAAAAHRGFEDHLRHLARVHPELGVHLGFSEALAHQVEAGSDYFLMPSLFEPCGLNQLYSQRYGTPPIVRRTGGLADSVVDGTSGFVFDAPTGFAFRGAIHRALQQFGTDAHSDMVQHVMGLDLGWERATAAYVSVYQRAIQNRTQRPDAP